MVKEAGPGGEAGPQITLCDLTQNISYHFCRSGVRRGGCAVDEGEQVVLMAVNRLSISFL